MRSAAIKFGYSSEKGNRLFIHHHNLGGKKRALAVAARALLKHGQNVSVETILRVHPLTASSSSRSYPSF